MGSTKRMVDCNNLGYVWKEIKAPIERLIIIFEDFKYDACQVKKAVEVVYSKSTCEFQPYYQKVFIDRHCNSLPVTWIVTDEICDYLHEDYPNDVVLNAKHLQELALIVCSGYCRMNAENMAFDIIMICQKYYGQDVKT